MKIYQLVVRVSQAPGPFLGPLFIRKRNEAFLVGGIIFSASLPEVWFRQMALLFLFLKEAHFCVQVFVFDWIFVTLK